MYIYVYAYTELHRFTNSAPKKKTERRKTEYQKTEQKKIKIRTTILPVNLTRKGMGKKNMLTRYNIKKE
jgi:hypothetical protein